ncbi:MAG: transcriptional regulator, partial [Mycobacterium sp.]
MQTPPAQALPGDHTRHQGLARSVVYRWFTTEASRALHLPEDQEAVARTFVASARVAYARDGTGSRAAHIVDALLERSPDFATLWKHHDVAQPAELRKRILHPKL